MAFEDGYYYGQCRIVGEALKTTDNGKHLSVTDGKGGNWSAQISNKSASVLVPGRAQYTVSLIDGSVVEWSGKVECGYGECIKVVLADGYDPVIQKDFDELKDQLSATVGSTKVPFEFAYDSTNGRFGYKVGADTVIPFLSKLKVLAEGNTVADKAYKQAYAVAWAAGGYGDQIVTPSVSVSKNGTTQSEIVEAHNYQYGFGYKYIVCDLGSLSAGDSIQRATSYSPNPSGYSGKYSGAMTVIVIE